MQASDTSETGCSSGRPGPGVTAVSRSAKHTLTNLTKIDLDPKKAASLEGLIGRVPAGYKLFPVHTFKELEIGEPKENRETRLDRSFGSATSVSVAVGR